MSRQTIYGKLSTADITYHIDEVNKNNRYSYICAECGSELFVVKSDARKKDWHFRHAKDSDLFQCRKRGLHDYVAQVLFNSSEVQLTKDKRIQYSNPGKETWLEDIYRSDVSVMYGEEILHFEVYVTSDLSQEKEAYYNDRQIKCVKLDFSKDRYMNMSKAELDEIILNSTNNKSLYGWEAEVKTEQNQDNFFVKYAIELILAGLAVASFFLIRYLFVRKRKSV